MSLLLHEFGDLRNPHHKIAALAYGHNARSNKRLNFGIKWVTTGWLVAGYFLKHMPGKLLLFNVAGGASGLPQTSPRPRYDPHQDATDPWHRQLGSNMVGGEFQPPPPPPPYPGTTGKINPGGHIGGPYPQDHRASGMPPMNPQGAGKKYGNCDTVITLKILIKSSTKFSRVVIFIIDSVMCVTQVSECR